MQNYGRANTLAKDNMRIMSKQTRNNAKTESNTQAQNEHKEGFIEIMFITFMTVIVGIRFALWKFAVYFHAIAIDVDA